MRKGAIIGVTILTGVAAFGYALYYYAKKQVALLEGYQYKINSFKIQTFDLQKIKGTISVYFASNTDIEVLVEKFYLDFYFNGVVVGYIEDATPFIIPARTQNSVGSTIIDFNFTLNPQLVIGNAADIIGYVLRQKDASISVRGYGKLKSGFVRATLPIVYDTTLNEIMTS
jgi:hypothetical protein